MGKKVNGNTHKARLFDENDHKIYAPVAPKMNDASPPLGAVLRRKMHTAGNIETGSDVARRVASLRRTLCRLENYALLRFSVKSTIGIVTALDKLHVDLA